MKDNNLQKSQNFLYLCKHLSAQSIGTAIIFFGQFDFNSLLLLIFNFLSKKYIYIQMKKLYIKNQIFSLTHHYGMADIYTKCRKKPQKS